MWYLGWRRSYIYQNFWWKKNWIWSNFILNTTPPAFKVVVNLITLEIWMWYLGWRRSYIYQNFWWKKNWIWSNFILSTTAPAFKGKIGNWRKNRSEKRGPPNSWQIFVKRKLGKINNININTKTIPTKSRKWNFNIAPQYCAM